MAILEPVDDHLSELPEGIIQYILSLLPIEDGARASCLSKTLLHAWQTRSILHLYEGVCYLNPRNSQRGGFLHYGNRSLQRHRDQKIGIKHFKLDFTTPIVSEWIQVALENGVKKLELLAHCNSFVMPGLIFEAKSPLELSVEGCCYSYLKLPKRMNKCQNLKSLHLYCLRLDNSDLQSITSSCPMIVDLFIRDCTGIGSFKVTNLSKLEQFESICEDFCERAIEVEAPSLDFFYCYGFQLSMSASQNLKQLQLIEVGISDEFFLDFKYRFPHLEDLAIVGCHNLQRIRMSSILLRKMELVIDSEDFFKELHIDAPNMTQFELINKNYYLDELQINAPSMTCFKYRGNLISKVSFTSASSHCYSHIDLIYSLDDNFLSTFFLVNLKEFLKNFSQSKISLFLDYNLNRGDFDTFDLKEAMDFDSFAAVQVHQLILPAVITEKFLDGVFWICHPKTIRIVSWNDHPKATGNVSSHKCSELAAFISKYLMFSRNQDDYCSTHIKFWKRSVKKMEFLEHISSPHSIFQLSENVLELEMET